MLEGIRLNAYSGDVVKEEPTSPPADVVVNSEIKIKNQDGSYTIVHPITKESNIMVEGGGSISDKINASTKLTTDVPNTVTVGGLVAGETYTDVSIADMLFKLTHPYVDPTISIRVTPNGGTYELGSTVASVNISATGQRKAEKLQKVRILKDGAPVQEKVATDVDTGNLTVEFIDNDIIANTSYRADVYDGVKTIGSSTVSFSFVNPAYIGNMAADVTVDNVTSDQIKALAKKVQGPGNLTQSFTVDNGKMCLVTPPGWSIKAIIDPNNFDITSSFSSKEVDVVCLDGTTKKYTIYLSALTTQTNFVVKFNR